MLTCPCNGIDPRTHHLSKIMVYMGIHRLLIFALKHILWVLVRTAGLTGTYNLCFELK